ncbi:DUF2254 domain-containing protein [Sphingopyxis sp. JAI128]|uniref:DUF2254 domain-containing protein n=1 Tax=Sphingopyxis sp. JAI128 TaxID=2723066 RepID=UPI00185E2671|nr:DUF2254 domain-containing protein [Sphingopyxis sp. JAI128]MBB6425338.1 putative membrane protein [Sphingopyxis sp. JAI128]
MSDGNISIIGRTTWLLRQFKKQIWVRATMFSLAAVGTALLAAVAGPYIPYDINLTLAAGSVDNILNILAASMLAVTTFSLSIMVSAYSAAASNVTPRSTKLLLGDSVAQNTLATFVGSFLFSIVGIIGVAAGVYGDQGRVILFVATLAVLFIITATLLRWIEQLGKFGRVGDTIKRVEKAARGPAEQWGGLPRLGARTWTPVPEGAAPVVCRVTGYLQHIDMSALNDIATDYDVTIHIAVLPGSFIHGVRKVAHVFPAQGSECREAIAACFTVDTDREYDQDPRFGLIVLSEIASRALSPAVNDPGTAIEVIGAGLRVFQAYSDARADQELPCFERLYARDLETSDLFDDFFNPIARDGAALIEVQLRLQFALEALAKGNPALYSACARYHAKLAFDRAADALASAHDRSHLTHRADWIEAA